MQPTDDMGLLREYAWGHAEDAFATLVTRHIDLVYSAALRHVGNHHQAEEITQAVFVMLARKARSLGPGTVLAGWLFRTARLTAANYLRTEIRRSRREQEAFMRSEPTENRGDPYVHLPTVERVGDELRQHLRQNTVNENLEAIGAGGLKGFDGLGVYVFKNFAE